ncbi:sporulation protein [Streptomyces sp. SID2131]|nr:sporulation protein [Streptomyces sp. SID2131]
MTDNSNETRPTVVESSAPTPEPASLLACLGGELGGRASVNAVYGEPVTANGVTVIPVARIGLAFGAGAGREAVPPKHGEGAGGGGCAGAQPLGFIQISNGTATYTPIRTSWRSVLLPLTAFLTGVAVPRLVRGLGERRVH